MKNLMLVHNIAGTNYPVRVFVEYFKKNTYRFCIENGDGTMSDVYDAFIMAGCDWHWSFDHIEKMVKARGFDFLQFKWTNSYEGERHPHLIIYAPDVQDRNRWSHGQTSTEQKIGRGWNTLAHVLWLMKQGNLKQINGREITDSEYAQLEKLDNDLKGWETLSETYGAWHPFGNTKGVTTQVVLNFLGVGTEVTPESLGVAAKKGETKPRLKIGDAVEVDGERGIVLSITGSGIVVQKAETKSTHAYEKVKAVELPLASQIEIDDTLRQAFNHTQEQLFRLYRAKLTKKERLSFPFFPSEDDEQQRELTDVNTCCCPVCGWQMVHMKCYTDEEDGTFVCGVCRQQGRIINIDENEVILFMGRRPSKNQFAIRETSCCGNCGNFKFEVGREGKRSTGYCRVSNVCLQGFNTCDFWFPREPEVYRSNMRQHTTNLGYGVSDARNTSRNDIRDTIYREEDHKAQKVRADKAVSAYTFAYRNMMDALTAEGKKLPLVEEADDAVKDKYGRELDNGV